MDIYSEEDTRRFHAEALRKFRAEHPLPLATESPTEYPSLTQQAKNFAGAMVKAAIDGFAQVDEAEAGRRLEICKACDKFDASAMRCRVCGCMAGLKTRLRTGSCPLSKW